MNHDAMGDAMLWVGALFVFTPIVLAGIVIGAIWLQRRGRRHGAPDVPVAGPPPD
jgi:hypothetical protein